MQIHVCIKDAVDWNMSTKDFRIDSATNEPAVSFARYQIDQYDEIALEVALQARTTSQVRVHALSVGADSTEDCLKHALSMSADAATLIRLSAPAARKIALLAAAIRREEQVGVVLCGLMSSAGGSGATGPRLAEALGVPCVSNVIALEAGAVRWRLWREAGEQREQLELAPPFVATVTNAESNRPRVPSMKDRMRGFREKVEVLSPAQLAMQDLEGQADPTRVLRRYVAHTGRECRFVGGNALEQSREVAAFIRRVLPSFNGPRR